MRILITGGTGLLGKSLLEEAPGTAGLTATGLSDPTPLLPARYRGFPLDVRDAAAVQWLVRHVEPTVVIHTASIGSVDYVQRHPDEARAVNVTGTAHIAAAAAAVGAYLVFISSNAVFDGTRAPYREEDPVCPVNIYGRLKVEAEQLVAACTTIPTAIVRPILMYGWNHPTERVNPVTWVLRELPRGVTLPVVTDTYTNPLWAPSCAQVIWRIVERQATGVFHVAGRDRVNRYEFAVETAKVFGLDPRQLKPVTSAFFPEIAPRAPDTSYDTSKMTRVLGLQPVSLQEGLEAMRRTRQ